MSARTSTTLARIGAQLYGPGYVLALADALQVSRRSLSRWLNDPGRFSIPPGVWPDLADLCEAHGKELRQIAKELRQ